MPRLKPAAYTKGDVLNGPAVNAREMYFVLNGTVDEYAVTIDTSSPMKMYGSHRHSSLRSSFRPLHQSSRASFSAAGTQGVRGPRFGEGMYFNEVNHVVLRLRLRPPTLTTTRPCPYLSACRDISRQRHIYSEGRVQSIITLCAFTDPVTGRIQLYQNAIQAGCENN